MSARIPHPVVYTGGEIGLANALDIRSEQLRTVKRCPDCNAYIIPTDNDIWLDAARAAADAPAVMGIMELGGMMLAASPAEGEGGSRHTIHEHQPDAVSDDA